MCFFFIFSVEKSFASQSCCRTTLMLREESGFACDLLSIFCVNRFFFSSCCSKFTQIHSWWCTLQVANIIKVPLFVAHLIQQSSHSDGTAVLHVNSRQKQLSILNYQLTCLIKDWNSARGALLHNFLKKRFSLLHFAHPPFCNVELSHALADQH